MDPSPERVRFGAYWLLRRLAKGGMAEIYLACRAEPKREGERLVIKRLLPQFSQDEEFLRMFLQEARLASQLAHPNIVRLFDLGLEGGHVYLAMEYIVGSDLETLTRPRHRWLSPVMAARVASEVCAALAYAHFATDLNGQPLHLVHRDVTPENVMISKRGEVKLVDFGVAKANAKLSATRPGVVRGKVAYMAPEHVAGREIDGRADLFSLGASLYELTTGIKPFERGMPAGSMWAVLHERPLSPVDVAKNYPTPFAAIVMRALEKDPDRRYAGAKEMKADLDRFLEASSEKVGAAELAALVELEAADPATRIDGAAAGGDEDRNEPTRMDDEEGDRNEPTRMDDDEDADRNEPTRMDEDEEEPKEKPKPAPVEKIPQPSLERQPTEVRPGLAEDEDDERDEKTQLKRPAPRVSNSSVATGPPRRRDPQTRVPTLNVDTRQEPPIPVEDVLVAENEGPPPDGQTSVTRMPVMPPTGMPPVLRRVHEAPEEAVAPDGDNTHESTQVKKPRPRVMSILLALLKGLLLALVILGAALLGRSAGLRDAAHLADLKAREAAAACTCPVCPACPEDKVPVSAGTGDLAALATSADGGGTTFDGGAPDAGTAAPGLDAGSQRPDASAPEGFGYIAVRGKGSVLIDDKACQAPCTAKVAAGEHVVRMAGKRGGEKKVVIKAGDRQVVKMP